MITPAQVREAIFNGSVYASYDGTQYYAHGIDMQAIADELNVKQGNGECENIGEPSDFCCSECEARLFTEVSDGYTMMECDETIIELPRYCPNCGRVVKR